MQVGEYVLNLLLLNNVEARQYNSPSLPSPALSYQVRTLTFRQIKVT